MTVTVQVFLRGEWRDLRSYADRERARAALALVRGLQPDLGFRLHTPSPPPCRARRRQGPGAPLLGAAFVVVAVASWWGAAVLAPRFAEPPATALAPEVEADLRLALDCAWLSGGFRGDAAKGRSFLAVVRAIAPGTEALDGAAAREIGARILGHGPEWVIGRARRCQDALPELARKYQ